MSRWECSVETPAPLLCLSQRLIWGTQSESGHQEEWYYNSAVSERRLEVGDGSTYSETEATISEL